MGRWSLRTSRASDGVDEASWTHCFGGDSAWSVGAADGLRVLRAGVAEGSLQGGCLSILAEALGTPYAPQITDGILFLEDIGTKPYQWDRMLLHLRYAGVLKRVRGIVFGDMRQCVSAEENDYLERAILHSLRRLRWAYRDWTAQRPCGRAQCHTAAGHPC